MELLNLLLLSPSKIYLFSSGSDIDPRRTFQYKKMEDRKVFESENYEIIIKILREYADMIWIYARRYSGPLDVMDGYIGVGRVEISVLVKWLRFMGQ